MNAVRRVIELVGLKSNERKKRMLVLVGVE
jgi:hypothetical protein